MEVGLFYISEKISRVNYSSLYFIFLEVNLRKSKWLVFGGYNNNKLNTDIFLSKLGPILDHYLPKFDNFLLQGDFNSEIHEIGMNEFCDIYNLQNFITDPTCFKNPLNPSSIDLILTNKPRSFENSQVIETGLSDHHKMTITVLRAFFQKSALGIGTIKDLTNLYSMQS